MEPSGIRTPPAFTKSIQRFPSAGGLALRSESEQPAIEAAFPNEPKLRQHDASMVSVWFKGPRPYQRILPKGQMWCSTACQSWQYFRIARPDFYQRRAVRIAE
jgi:hypothetical protein